MPDITVNNKAFEIEGILFDKDGTLLDFSQLWVYWGEKWIQEIKKTTKITDMNEYQLGQIIGLDIGANTWDPEGPLAIGSMDDLTTLFSHHLYSKGIPWNEAITIVINSRETVSNSILWDDHLKSISGLKTLLHQLDAASVQLGVITSDDTDSAKQHLKILEIDNYFGCIIGHDAAPQRGKPFPDMVEYACQQLNIQPQNTMMIGDSNGDMMAGKNAHLLACIGIIPEQITTSSHLKDADQLIKNYENMIVK